MILALWSPVLQFQLPALLFVCVLFVLLFVVVLSGEPKQNQGRGMVDRKLVEAPKWPSQGGSSVWFFGDFRCGVPLSIVILVIYKYKNR